MWGVALGLLIASVTSLNVTISIVLQLGEAIAGVATGLASTDVGALQDFGSGIALPVMEDASSVEDNIRMFKIIVSILVLGQIIAVSAIAIVFVVEKQVLQVRPSNYCGLQESHLGLQPSSSKVHLPSSEFRKEYMLVDDGWYATTCTTTEPACNDHVRSPQQAMMGGGLFSLHKFLMIGVILILIAGLVSVLPDFSGPPAAIDYDPTDEDY